MKRSKKPSLSQQWERLMRRREETIARLVHIEAKAAKLRRAMGRAHKKAAKLKASWDQSPLPDDSLTDISLGQ